jgi:hypothetical protein
LPLGTEASEQSRRPTRSAWEKSAGNSVTALSLHGYGPVDLS